MSEKITLRLKSNHEVVVEDTGNLSYTLRGWGLGEASFLSERDWEPVPPPYKLPTGLGAVVQDQHGVNYVLTDPKDTLAWIGGGGEWMTDGGVLDRAPLTTLSEGVKA